MRHSVQLIIAAAATAIAFALYARVEMPWMVLGWIGLVPWLAELDRVESLRRALLAGVLMCLAFVLGVFAWFGAAMQTYTGAPWPIALLVLLLLAPLIQPQLIVFAAARYVAQRRARSRWYAALAGAFAYVGTEWATGKLFSDTLGHGLYASSLMRQAADLAGAGGLTFVLIAGNECVLTALRAFLLHTPRHQRWSRALAPLAGAAGLALSLLVYGVIRERQLDDQGAAAERITAGVVQADISRYGELAAEMGTFDAVRMILDAHFALSSEALGGGTVDLLVWPETVYPTTFGAPKSADGAAFDREIADFVAHAGVPLVFGAYDTEDGKEFNAAVLLGPSSDGQLILDTYRKAALFPLTERTPALLDTAAVRRWLPWLGTWTPGPGPQALPLALRGGRVVRIAPMICYEAVDPSHAIAAVRQGAELLVTLSNDSWFAAGGGPRLHLVVSAFRSLETRRPQVRATNTGISAVITPTGELLATLGVHERRTLVATVTPVRHTWTLMLAWGDWFGPTSFACGIAMLVASAFRPRASTTDRAL